MKDFLELDIFFLHGNFPGSSRIASGIKRVAMPRHEYLNINSLDFDRPCFR